MPTSPGCRMCKTRKIKCDEALPQCEKCVRAGKTCPGYSIGTELAIRDMTQLTEKKVQSRVQNSLRARDRAEKNTAQNAEELTPCSDWRTDALARFFIDYGLYSDAVSYSTAIVTELCGTSDADFCLKEARSAAAFANHANQLGLEWMVVEANKAYGRALTSLMRALQDPVEALKDTTLAAVYMISIYEGISGYIPTGTLMDHHHHGGRMTLIQNRGEQQFDTRVGRCLFALVNEQAMIKCLTRHQKPPEEASSWLELFAAKETPLEGAELGLRTAEICAEAQLLFDSNEHGQEWENGLLNVVQDIGALDLQYQDWTHQHSISKIWCYHTLCLFPDPTVPRDGKVRLYYDLLTAFIWITCLSRRAHLHEVLLHCLSLLGWHLGPQNLSTRLKLQGSVGDQLVGSRFIIEDMVSGICATVPFMLGDVDSAGKTASESKRRPIGGYLIWWHLHVARASTEDGSEREAWIQDRLKFIDSKMGVKFASLIANSVKREPWNLRPWGGEAVAGFKSDG